MGLAVGRLLRELFGERRRDDLAQIGEAAFGFRYHLLADDQDVAVLAAQRAVVDGVEEQGGEIVSPACTMGIPETGETCSVMRREDSPARRGREAGRRA